MTIAWDSSSSQSSQSAGPKLCLEAPDAESAPASVLPRTTPRFPRTERGFRLYTDREIEQLPVPPQLIDGILPANGLAELFGPEGSFKTFLALDIAVHVSLGREWRGCSVRRGIVVYVYAEGRGGLGARLAALKEFYNVDALGILFLPQRMDVNDLGDCSELLSAIYARVGGHADIALIVIDTLNRNSTGDENDTNDMSVFVQGCDVLREKTGATVLVVHHPGRTNRDRGRGSGVLDGAADTIISVERAANRITLECRKQKDGPEFKPLQFEKVLIAGSMVLRASDASVSELKGQRLQALRALHENSTESGLRHKAWHETSGISNSSSFDNARKWLKSKGFVRDGGGCWHATDDGLVALRGINSTDSTATPPAKCRAGPTLLHQGEGVRSTPPVELDPRGVPA